MKTFFIRSNRLQRSCANTESPDTDRAAQRQNAPQDNAVSQAMALDTLTTWPTHRIRNFLTMQSRSGR